MKYSKQIRNYIANPLWALMALLFGFDNCGYAWDYGNGRHGSFVLTTNATIEQLYQTVRLTNDPAQYNPSDSNAIPNFQNLTITNGAMLYANAWNGTNGGWIVFKARGSVLICSNCAISASGIGYRGGGYITFAGFSAGIQGESYAGTPATNTSGNLGANYGGGGGGNTVSSGGGGGYATAGTAGNLGNGGSHTPGGGTYGTASLAQVYLGSGGGGGDYSYGANGGGAIVINAGVLKVQGGITAAGNGSGGTGSGGAGNGEGGAGSGGSILLNLGSGILGTNLVNASGGNGSPGYGGSGGDGRIAIQYAEIYTGITAPGAYTLNDTNSDGIQITNQPGSRTNFLGDNVQLSVGFTTISPYTMQWYFNGETILGATNQILNLVNLSLTNQGNYWLDISNTATTINSSNMYFTVLDTNMPFGDGIPNWWKEEYGLSTNNPTLATNNPPSDKLTYLEKYLYGLNPLTNDTDGDGLTDYDEIFIYHANPLSTNTAGDGIPDGWKITNGLNPSIADSQSEAGFDGVTYMQVYQYNLTHKNQLDPRNPFSQSGTSMYEIINAGQHTNRFYYDHEDRLVGAEYSRGISIGYQYDGNGNLPRQTVLSRTAETNGLPVLWLWLNRLTNQPGIASVDSGGNGWDNYQEWLTGLSPISNNVPSLLYNPGTNIASLALPFAPSNFVECAGQVDGLGSEEIVLGADGNPGTNSNYLLILTQTTSGWSTQRVYVGSFGITSIAVGQPANRPSTGIYVGLRGTNGSGKIMELTGTGGIWQSNVVATSTNEAEYVGGVRQNGDLLVSFATNNMSGALWSLSFSNNEWNGSLVSSNASHRGIPGHGLIFSHSSRDSSIRLLDAGGIEVTAGTMEYYKDDILLPQGLFNTNNGKMYFNTPVGMSWTNAQNYFSGYHGTLTLPANASENTWLATNYSGIHWIGLYWVFNGSTYSPYYANGSPAPSCGNSGYCGYAQWGPGSPNYPPLAGPIYGTIFNDYSSSGNWGTIGADGVWTGLGEVDSPIFGLTNQWLISEPKINPLTWRELQLATGRNRPSTNLTSIFYCCVDDRNFSSNIDSGDNLVFAEYQISNNVFTTATLTNIPVGSGSVAQSYALAAVDYLGSGLDCVFTAEPNGAIYSWSATNASAPLQRQLFSSDYAGTAWHALTSVKMAAVGEGLAGLMVNPTNQNTCNVIFWAPQAVLPTPQPSMIETAPSAAVIPSANPLGSNAIVTVRLWDNEGDASTLFLQYQFLGDPNWHSATLTALDGAAYSPAIRATAFPTGSNHTVGWNALNDVGANVVTNILLRASAHDFMLAGGWSMATPFALNTTIPSVSTPTNPPYNFTGTRRVQGGIQFTWQGGTNAWLYLQRSPALTGTNALWMNIWTGTPPTPVYGIYTDFFGTNPMEYYRFNVVSP